MQRLILAFAIAVVVLGALLAFALLSGGGDAQDGPVDLQPVGATHVPGKGIEVRVANFGEFDFDGNVTLRLTQDTSTVTTTARLKLPAGNQASTTIPPPRGQDDWQIEPSSPQFELVVDPREQVDETNRENNTMLFVCYFEGQDCDGD
ncbi:MAG: hypothetical protein Kow0010_11040 [Dehalococcoidia bacterium]